MEEQKILYADDDPEIREVLKLLLTGEGYEAIGASSGSELLNLLDDSVSLVILDVMMPGMTGYAVCAEIRRRSAAYTFLDGKISGLGQDHGLFCRWGRLPGKAVFVQRAHIQGESHAAPLLCLRGALDCFGGRSDTLLRKRGNRPRPKRRQTKRAGGRAY